MKPGPTLATMLLITVTACASTTREPGEPGGDGSLTRVRDAGALVVSSSNDGPNAGGLTSDNIAITVKRSQQVDFSAPMYRTGQALVVPKANPAGVQAQEDFAGHAIGSYLGTPRRPRPPGGQPRSWL